ncbi:MAG: hydrogenase iron-sulfur subunit [Eubacteriales bacterium]
MSSGPTIKPKILGFVCNWCCYGGADLCGVSRFQYPPYIRLIRVMCSARVDMAHVFLALSTGQDGVFIGGCHLNDCHYITNGNYDAFGMVSICKKILGHIGVNPDRLRLEWVSAGEGIRFANVMNDFGTQIANLGPLGRIEGTDGQILKLRLEAAAKLVPYIKLVQTERMSVPVRTEEEYHRFFASEEFNRLFEETIAEKLAVGQIIALLQKGPLATPEISKALGLTPSEVSRFLISSSRQKFVRYDEGLKRYALA